MVKQFYSNGKLLLSGEYVVLDGAMAFALPTRYGQYLEVKRNDKALVSWESYEVNGQLWMREDVALDDITCNSDIPEGSAYYRTLVQVLRAAHYQNPTVFSSSSGYEVTSKLTFPRLWGLGTSSTWINNVAQWFNINPYQLLQESFGGSGYDIACAQFKQGVYYTVTDRINPKVELIDFNPSFSEHIYFVYLNQKKDSKEAIANYSATKYLINEQIDRISSISHSMSICANLDEFQCLMDEHERIMSKVLGVEKVKDELFADFSGSIKSLGGWGGDFVMVASSEDPSEYFLLKGYKIVIKFKDMILF